MNITIESVKDNPVNLFRRAGYAFQRNEGAEMSFVRSMARSGFPRFHIFAKIENSTLLISIHLDQKKETYGSGTRHHGEYEDEGALKTEVERIKNILK